MENMERHTKSAEEVRIESGLKELAELSQREARGEQVSAELEALVDELTDLNAGDAMIKAALQKGLNNEFGNDIDPIRFKDDPDANPPAYLRHRG